MVTFTPFRNPDTNLAGEVKFRFLETKFGDGYSARLSDGLNGQDETYSPTWANILPEDAQTLEDFFNEREGWKSFDYTIPYEDTSKKWVCKQYSRGYPTGVTRTISAQFERVYLAGASTSMTEYGVVSSILKAPEGSGIVALPTHQHLAFDTIALGSSVTLESGDIRVGASGLGLLEFRAVVQLNGSNPIIFSYKRNGGAYRELGRIIPLENKTTMFVKRLGFPLVVGDLLSFFVTTEGSANLLSWGDIELLAVEAGTFTK